MTEAALTREEVVARLAAATPGMPADLSRLKLNGLDLAGLDFTGADVTSARLIDLRGAESGALDVARNLGRAFRN